jgi:chromosomal replication initiator protein
MVMIAMEVAEKYGISVKDIRSPSKRRPVAWPRQEFYYETMKRTKRSTVQIGLWCGGRDHTTVMHGWRRHAARNDLPNPR